MNIKNYYLSLLLIVFSTITALAGTAPIVTAISPQAGPVGTSVTITGSNFNAVLSGNIVYFGATLATVTAASATSLTVIAPSGASFQPVTVLNTANGLIGYSPGPFITTNTTNSFTFKPKVDSATGASPKMIAAGDFDNDGKPDLVVTNTNANSLSVFANAGTAATVKLKSPITLATGLNPSGVAIGDLDGDGKLDIAVAIGGSNTIYLFRNTSSGGNMSFAGPDSILSTPSPKNIAIADIDGDGRAEIIAAPDTTNKIDIFRNKSVAGALSFYVKKTLGIGGPPQSIATCDLDGDGKPEVVVAFGNGISVLINGSTTGVINFSGVVNIATGTSAQVVATGDIDGDGKTDLAISNSGSNNVSVLLNTSTIGAFSFAPKKSYPVGSNPIGVAINDVNGDGLPDIISSNFMTDNISVLINTSTMGSSSFNTMINQASGTMPTSLVVLDLDGDGRPDVATANSTANTTSVILNSFYVLAVDALTFTAVKTSDGVQLNWKTLTEVKTNYFYIEESKDGIVFHVIDSVLIKGNGNQITYYNYTDKNPATGLSYYRLSIKDIDKNIKFSNVSIVEWQPYKPFHLSISPMPVNAVATVKITGIPLKGVFHVFNGNGKLVTSYTVPAGSNSFKINQSNNPAGMYYYKFITNAGEIKTTGKFLTK